MELFLDSVDLTEIKKYNMIGILDGVTTNPSLMTGSNNNFRETVSNICAIVKGGVSVEVISNDFEGMLKEGETILSIAKNVVVKLPITWDGLRACRYFVDKGHKVNMTLCFTANQGLLAAKAGATYVSPFVGRLDDIGDDGMMLISEIRTIFDNYSLGTKILAASIRSSDHVAEAGMCGADIVTLPPKVFSKLLDHDLTAQGIYQFNQDWAKSRMKIED